jgi:sulfoxide reductase heme-binding subunit YedZ
LVGDGSFARVPTLPFQVFGALALVILFLMAATSHDFWLVNLSAPVWKALHLLVYAAYGLLVAHVAFGAGQMAGGGWLLAGTAAGAAGLVTLHVLAAARERRVDADGPVANTAADGWVEVCGVDDIADTRARIVSCGGERVAIFRYDGKLSAVSNVCQHQNGPLGEGRVIDGCITCPWHGYQYRPETGSSPPPFTEKVCTFRVEVRGGRVWLDPRPLPPGTRVEPAKVASVSSS